MRLLFVALPILCALGCGEVAFTSAELDELDRIDPSGPIDVPLDASTPSLPDPELANTIGRTPDVEVRSHDCHEPCGEACALNEVCCLSTSTCLPIDCPDCCPDPEFRRIAAQH
jgi:hypothetical protein